MAMERLLTSLVFCEAPLDAAFYGAASVNSAVSGVKKLAVVSGSGSGAGSSGTATTKLPAAATAADGTKKEWWGGQRQAGYDLAFDGINCFETVVMH